MEKRVALLVMLLFGFTSDFFAAVVPSLSNSPQIKRFFEFPTNDTLKKYCASFFIARYGNGCVNSHFNTCPNELRVFVQQHIERIKRYLLAQVGSCAQEAQVEKLNLIICDAIQQKRIDILKVIIECLYVAEGYPAICLLASDGHSQSCKYLLDNGEDINRRNLLKKTPLMCAAQNGREETVILLLQKNANLDFITPCNKNAMELAQDKGYANIALQIMREKVEREKKKLTNFLHD